MNQKLPPKPSSNHLCHFPYTSANMSSSEHKKLLSNYSHKLSETPFKVTIYCTLKCRIARIKSFIMCARTGNTFASPPPPPRQKKNIQKRYAVNRWPKISIMNSTDGGSDKWTGWRTNGRTDGRTGSTGAKAKAKPKHRPHMPEFSFL